MTPLDKSLKRSLNIKGVDYVVTLSPETLKLALKGHRLGVELKWADLTSGESALAVALHASVGQFEIDNKAVANNASGIQSAPSRRAIRVSPRKRTR
jgi:hypothetical protein